LKFNRGKVRKFFVSFQKRRFPERKRENKEAIRSQKPTKGHNRQGLVMKGVGHQKM